MKSSYILAAGGALLLSACAPMKYPALTPQPTTRPHAQSVQHANPYVHSTVAQQAPVVHNGYAQPRPLSAYMPQQPAQPIYTTDPMTGQVIAYQHPTATAQPTYTTDPVTGQLVPIQQPTYVDPMGNVEPTPAYPTTSQTQPGMTAISGIGNAPAGPAQPQPVTGSTANYAVQMINGTTGRLFVEVFDDSDNVFPVGYMFAGANLSTPPSEARPIQGQLTVVIRDPDKPDAPELRRYKVTPPANYTNKTIGITILPGGRYRASLDGQVYYASPDPKAATPEAAPAPAATPAPAPAPAPAAPAPSTAPANIL